MFDPAGLNACLEPKSHAGNTTLPGGTRTVTPRAHTTTRPLHDVPERIAPSHRTHHPRGAPPRAAHRHARLAAPDAARPTRRPPPPPREPQALRRAAASGRLRRGTPAKGASGAAAHSGTTPPAGANSGCLGPANGARRRMPSVVCGLDRVRAHARWADRWIRAPPGMCEERSAARGARARLGARAVAHLHRGLRARIEENIRQLGHGCPRTRSARPPPGRWISRPPTCTTAKGNAGHQRTSEGPHLGDPAWTGGPDAIAHGRSEARNLGGAAPTARTARSQTCRARRNGDASAKRTGRALGSADGQDQINEPCTRAAWGRGRGSRTRGERAPSRGRGGAARRRGRGLS